MNLDRRGREYMTWRTHNAPAGLSFEVNFDDSDVWHQATAVDDEVILLVAGPEAADNPGDTVVLDLGTHPVVIRAADNPEILVRKSGSVTVR